ncbi:hypothetical protein PFLUV_G00081930 [Perca fluviatilis]|uniref:Uncharacterized protein n=1 Tax=Perca fluviatilis TaxID=8168 RepID=A0A6A5F8J0_PERFL|nr:hypothetical protein PFLUV_G00081930 [Perca fluviatilis]
MEIIRGWIREPPISYSYTLAGSDAPPLEIGGESDNRLLSVRHGHAERAAVKAGVRLHANQSSATWLALLLTLSLAQTHDDVLCWQQEGESLEFRLQWMLQKKFFLRRHLA